MNVNGCESPLPFDLISNQQHVVQESPGTDPIIPTQNIPHEKTFQNRTIVFLEEEKTRAGSFKISHVERCVNNVVIPWIVVNALEDQFKGFENISEQTWSATAQALQNEKGCVKVEAWVSNRQELSPEQCLEEDVREELLGLFDGEHPQEIQDTLSLYCFENVLSLNESAKSIAQSIRRFYEEELSRQNVL